MRITGSDGSSFYFTSIMRKKQIIVFILLCIFITFTAITISASLAAQTNGELSRSNGYTDTIIDPQNIKEIHDTLKYEGGNICLVSLPGSMIEEWIKFNKPTENYRIFVIHQQDDIKLSYKKNIQIATGSFEQALFDFTFDQKKHECDIIHFGALSEHRWEAAWLASRMFAKKNNTAIWHRSYSYHDRVDAFINKSCLETYCTGSIQLVNTNHTFRADVALQLEYAKYIPKKGNSINFFAYTLGQWELERSLETAVVSARTYRKIHQKGGAVQLTLFTNDRNFVDREQIFDRIIGIRDDLLFNEGRQFVTRAIYASFAPYHISLFVDSDTWNCGELDSFFEFMNEHHFDFAVNGHVPEVFHLPDCGVFAYKWSERTRLLLKEWFTEFYDFYWGDDQRRLLRAMRKRAGKVRIGLLRTTHSCRFSPGEGEGWDAKRMHQQTMILDGPAKIIHAREANADICEVLNQHADRRRIFVCRSGFTFDKNLTNEEKQVKLNECLHPVFNQEDCQKDLDNRCHKNNWLWHQDIISPNRDFVPDYWNGFN